MAHRFLIAIVGLCALAGVAAAQPPPYDDQYYVPQPYVEPKKPKDPWEKARFEGAVGALIGGQRVGYVSGTAGGLHLDAGVRFHKLFPFLEYDFMSVGDSAYDEPEPVRGFMHRFSLNLRYSLGAFGGKGDLPVRGDIWAELGAGHQEIHWHEGGRLGRKDASFGFGAQATFRVGKVKPRYIGVYYAMKATIAMSPERKDDMPICAGPCDEATGPSPWDFGIYFNFGVPFGK